MNEENNKPGHQSIHPIQKYKLNCANAWLKCWTKLNFNTIIKLFQTNLKNGRLIVTFLIYALYCIFGFPHRIGSHSQTLLFHLIFHILLKLFYRINFKFSIKQNTQYDGFVLFAMYLNAKIKRIKLMLELTEFY